MVLSSKINLTATAISFLGIHIILHVPRIVTERANKQKMFALSGYRFTMSTLEHNLLYSKAICCLSFLLSSLHLWGQTQPVYNVQSPEAASLGLYESIPVSHFTGIPDISIPLYEVAIGDFHIPVTANYHLSAVKPHQQQTILGLGWSLDAGGYISRTVRGVYDEKIGYNQAEVGYYYHHSEMANMTNSQFDNTLRTNAMNYEISADEFFFNFCGYVGRFYLSPDGQWIVVSDQDIKVEFFPENGFISISEFSNRFNFHNWNNYSSGIKYFCRFVLITPDGSRYEFGGKNAMEFSIPYYNRANSDLVPTTWRLSSITTPERRQIQFEYDTSSIMCNLQYAPSEINKYGIWTTSGDVKQYGWNGFTGFLTFPVNLKTITTPNERLDFCYFKDPLYAAKYNYNDVLCWSNGLHRYDPYSLRYELSSVSGFKQLLKIPDVDYEHNGQPYNKNTLKPKIASLLCSQVLHRIAISDKEGNGRKSIYFSYNTAGTRKLSQITERHGTPNLAPIYDSNDSIINYTIPSYGTATDVSTYSFSYNTTQMPQYIPWTDTDSWGFYNGSTIQFGQQPAYETKIPNLNASCAETLTDIIYPTGGRRHFTFSQNTCGAQIVDSTASVNYYTWNHTIGGLRINEVSDFDKDGHKISSRRYYYTHDLVNRTSGLSSGIAKNAFRFSQVFNATGDDGLMTIEYKSTNSYFPSSTNHCTPDVGYSWVIEEIKDGNDHLQGFVRYNYSNYDQDVYGNSHSDEVPLYSNFIGDPTQFSITSNSIERGKLLSKEFFDASLRLIKKTSYRYQSLYASVMPTANHFFVTFDCANIPNPDYFAVSYATLGSLFNTNTKSYMLSSVCDSVISTNDDIVTSMDEMQYNSHKLVNMEKKKTSTGSYVTTTYTYAPELSQYAWMNKYHIFTPVASKYVSSGNESERDIWRYGSKDAIPYIMKHEKVFNSGLEKNIFEVTATDYYGNPTEILENGLTSVLLWGGYGQKLIAKIDNVSLSQLHSQCDIDAEILSTRKMTAINFNQLRNVQGTISDALVTVYEYDDNLLLKSICQPDGRTTTFSYDDFGRLTENCIKDIANNAELIENKYSYHYQVTNNSLCHIDTKISKDGSANNCLTTSKFYDGFGREKESLEIGITPNGESLATLTEYDAYGRKSKTWLPTPVTASAADYIPFETIEQDAYLTYNNDSCTYTSTIYGKDPTGRVQMQYGPGEKWRQHGRAIRTDYMSNNGTDSLTCRLWSVSGTTITTTQSYPSNTLNVVRTEDEDGKVLFEFTDRQGKVVLRRQKNTSSYIDTYFLYNAMGYLQAVLPPAASDEARTRNTLRVSTVNKYAYLYTYDTYMRLSGKKLPGTDWQHFFYDKADRLVYSQDGNQHENNEYTFYAYDVFGRECLRGTFISSQTLNNLDDGYSLCTFTGTSNSWLGYVVSGINVSSPTITHANYYDDYGFISATSATTWPANILPQYSSSLLSASTKGLLTGTVSALFSPSSTQTQYVYKAYYYDYRDRMIHSEATNHLGGTDKENLTLSFTGMVLSRVHTHDISGSAPQTEVYTYTYDNADRLTTVKHKLNNGNERTLAEYVYDEVGRVSQKTLNATETVNYGYNIRGWLTDISSLHFSEDIYYETPYANCQPLYCGNVGAIDYGLGAYTFTYDKLGRLSKADYWQNGTKKGYYSTSYSYDMMGNITSLYRKGLLDDDTYAYIDEVEYVYNGNQAVAVHDDPEEEPSYSSAFHFIDGDYDEEEYTYDANGNMTKNTNKFINRIEYNGLNLPLKITFNQNGKAIYYTYDADGTKRIVNYTMPNSSVTHRTDYCGNFIYEDGVLKRILLDDGFIGFNGTTPSYFCYLKDHQGNIRSVLNSSGAVQEYNRYYPYGTTHGSQMYANIQPYKYNGKELDRMHGLDLYDYGARYYDATMARWTSMDPLCEQYYSISPYAYCANNPVSAIDPDGQSTWVVNKGNGLYQVVGGDVNDKDRNIYVGNKNKDNVFIRQKSIGISSSTTSFYNSDNKGGTWMIGSIIDVNDKSGDRFLSGIIGKNPPLFDDYMRNARNNMPYDFKSTNGNSEVLNKELHYRGMPIGTTKDGQPIFSSARDIGNIAAGYIAAANGMSWEMSRIAFDFYQGGIEGVSTRNAEYYGWRLGWYNTYNNQKADNLLNSIQSLFESMWNNIFR